jgi:hypothetical protein
MATKSTEILYEPELARLLGINPRTVERQRKSGKLPFSYVRVGSKTIYSRQSVMSLLEQGAGNATDETTKK